MPCTTICAAAASAVGLGCCDVDAACAQLASAIHTGEPHKHTFQVVHGVEGGATLRRPSHTLHTTPPHAPAGRLSSQRARASQRAAHGHVLACVRRDRRCGRSACPSPGARAARPRRRWRPSRRGPRGPRARECGGRRAPHHSER
eukprot:365042-Chlamydomonas_euryale.AAC.45